MALTNVTACFLPSVIDNGVSDGHSMILIPTKLHLPLIPSRTIKYRTYKNFDENIYRDAVAQIPFSITEVFDDPSDILTGVPLI